MQRRLLLTFAAGLIALAGLFPAGCSDDTITHYSTPGQTDGTQSETQDDTFTGLGDDIDVLTTDLDNTDTTTGILDKGENDDDGGGGNGGGASNILPCYAAAK